VAGSTPNLVAQDAEENTSYGQQCIDYGNHHIAYHTQRCQQISDAVDTLGDVHDQYKKTWHNTTKHAYLAAHTSHGNAWIQQGTNAKGDAVAFPDAEQENANNIWSLSADGSAGASTSNGTPT
jgi:hypothetical protein